ncbi:MAG TPA: glutamine-hydrolyzing carbamoyl-phosphate synthase small subunit [Acidisoma sp.]|uniref:glutamine-hydrolyzing carbamoyl-phosphate synthase small subunit n=1 Tax=Acidisoma sp. TaxID=1872115 RepID=UPI002CD72935|nr:glutamine-hydrolyzing carbamoyl-phosphate synthase small subunit [Acidisoma sp.]HTI02776.1 glutamine-hydrolyzing carbamoyl-phosphate synthase small subunit [Acidisoma sp.]
MPLAVNDIVQRLGGPEAAARLTNVSLEALRKWKQAGTIPSKHWRTILAATGLTLSDMPGSALSGSVTDPVSKDVPTMPDAQNPASLAPPEGATAVLVLADGSLWWGRGFGAHTPEGGARVGEVCFNTGLTGYQETMTDPSFAGQIVTFTFPHIGNVGANPQDDEAGTPAARGLVTAQDVTEPSNWRAARSFVAWLQAMDLPGIGGIDTRALTMRIRDGGAPSGVLAFPASGRFDIPALQAQAAAWPGLEGMDLAKEVSCTQSYEWTETVWQWGEAPALETGGHQAAPRHHVVAVDYGAKRNILRSLASAGCRVTVVPATATAEDILRHQPDGLFLSNGPGDPAATAAYAVPAIQGVMATGLPIFGICLGHQLLATALGAKTYKLDRGHRGANQPVKDLATGKVEITSQNHGFAVDDNSLPDGVEVSHVSLFDGSNEGIRAPRSRAFSVQYHPEASPGPSDSHHLFHRFVAMMDADKAKG